MMRKYEQVKSRILGPVVPLNIPFKADEEIDYDALERYVDWLGEGVPVLILSYGSSEFGALTDYEIYEITKVVANANQERAHFVGASRCWPLQEVVKYIDFARRFSG